MKHYDFNYIHEYSLFYVHYWVKHTIVNIVYIDSLVGHMGEVCEERQWIESYKRQRATSQSSVWLEAIGIEDWNLFKNL